jgi:hypothetical protein
MCFHTKQTKFTLEVLLAMDITSGNGLITLR